MKYSWGIVMAAGALAVSFIGCQPPKTDSDGGGQDTIPVRGDHVRMAVPNEPDNLHPFASSHAIATYIRDQLHMYLSDFDPVTLELEPVLIEALPTISEDYLRYSYSIRPEATWDDGKPITGHDFKFSIKAMIFPLAINAHSKVYYDFVKDVEVDSTNPKKFTVVNSKRFHLAMHALGGFEIIPKHLYDPKNLLDGFTIAQFQEDVDNKLAADPKVVEFAAYFNSDSVKFSPNHNFGAGPYKLESWVANEGVVLKRKDSWWGDNVKDKVVSLQAYPDKLIYKPIRERPAAAAALAAGEVDLIWDVLPDEFNRIKNDTNDVINKTCNLKVGDSYSWTYIGLNTRPPVTRKPVLAELAVRRALAHCADIDNIIKKVYAGYGIRIVGPISPHNKNEYHTGLKPIPYDINEANRLLDSAGWKDTNSDGIRDKMIKGKKVELVMEMLVSNSSTTAPIMGEILAENALKAGMKINLVKEQMTPLALRLSAHDFDMFGLGFNGNPLPSDLQQVWHTRSWTSGGSNYTGFGNAASDSLIEQIRVTMTPEERKPLYYKFQEMVYQEQPMIFVMSPKERVIFHKRFRNAEVYLVRPGFEPRSLWVPLAEQKFGNAKPVAAK